MNQWPSSNLIISFIFINLILSVHFTCSKKVKISDGNWSEVNLLNLTSLSFYSNHYTIGDNVVPQLQCKVNDQDCDFQPALVKCTNLDYHDLTKVNKTLSDLNWSCTPIDSRPNAYVIKEKSAHVNCQLLNRTSDAIIVAQGSCYLVYSQDKNSSISNLLELESLSFYADQYTTGDKKVPQLQCKSNSQDCDYFQPKQVVCKNLDFHNFTKANATVTQLSWSCNSRDFISTSYYIVEKSEVVNCHELYRSNAGIFVEAGSCYLIYEQEKSPLYRNLLIGFIVILVLSLGAGFYCYFRTKRQGYEPIV